MDVDIRRLLVVLVLASAACAPAERPASLDLLRDAVGSEGDAGRVGGASAREEASRYLELAERAMDEGDAGEADRLGSLGLIQHRISEARRLEAEARERSESASAAKRDLEMDLSRVEDEAHKLERGEERDRIRAHLLEVVGKTAMRAAAEEEAREEVLTGARRGELEDARAEVARQMIGRLRVKLEIGGLLVRAGLVEEERLLPLHAAMEIARDRLARSDLAGVQEGVEKGGVELARILWSLRSADGEGAGSAIGKVLEGAGFSPVEEEGALVVGLPASSSKAAVRAEALGEALEGAGGVLVLAVSSAPGDRTGPGPQKKTLKRAEDIARALVDAGLEESRVASFGAGTTRPSAVLAAGKRSSAVVIVPLPVAR